MWLRGCVCTFPGALGQHGALGISNECQEYTVFLEHTLIERLQNPFIPGQDTVLTGMREIFGQRQGAALQLIREDTLGLPQKVPAQTGANSQNHQADKDQRFDLQRRLDGLHIALLQPRGLPLGMLRHMVCLTRTERPYRYTLLADWTISGGRSSPSWLAVCRLIATLTFAGGTILACAGRRCPLSISLDN